MRLTRGSAPFCGATLAWFCRCLSSWALCIKAWAGACAGGADRAQRTRSTDLLRVTSQSAFVAICMGACYALFGIRPHNLGRRTVAGRKRGCWHRVRFVVACLACRCMLHCDLARTASPSTRRTKLRRTHVSRGEIDAQQVELEVRALALRSGHEPALAWSRDPQLSVACPKPESCKQASRAAKASRSHKLRRPVHACVETAIAQRCQHSEGGNAASASPTSTLRLPWRLRVLAMASPPTRSGPVDGVCSLCCVPPRGRRAGLIDARAGGRAERLCVLTRADDAQRKKRPSPRGAESPMRKLQCVFRFHFSKVGWQIAECLDSDASVEVGLGQLFRLDYKGREETSSHRRSYREPLQRL